MAAVAVVSVLLFLLGCAFAAYSGYILSRSGLFACFGIVGAVASILAAGIGVCLAASPSYRPSSGRFAALSMMSLSALFGTMLITTFMA
jgi:hypothetical protein